MTPETVKETTEGGLSIRALFGWLWPWSKTWHRWRCNRGLHATYIMEIKTRCWAVVDREECCKHCNYSKTLHAKIKYD